MSELLSTILEKYVARSGPDSGEQDFVDKHTDNINVTDAPGREGPSEGEKRKKAARRKVNQGEDDPEDEEAMYEQAEVDSVIAEYYEEASEEEREVLDQMMETEEGRAELAQWILEADDEDDDSSEDDDEDDDSEEDDNDMKKEDVDLDEAHSKWTVELPDQKKTVTVDKARNSAEAIKKAVTQSGGKADDWKHVKVGKITKVKE